MRQIRRWPFSASRSTSESPRVERFVLPGRPVIWDKLREALRAEQPVVLATEVEGPNMGAKLLITPDERLGSLGDPELDRIVVRDATAMLESGLTGTRHYGEHGEARKREV